MAQDDYYYEIQLTNKQLVFYFLAGATGLILSFLAGVMVGKGVDPAPPVEARVDGERITPESPVALAEEDLSFPASLEEDSAPPAEAQPTAPPPTPAPTAAVPASTPRSTPPPTPVPTPTPRAPPTTAAAASPATAVPAPPGGFFTIQVGAYRDEASAIELKNGLNAKGFAAYVVTPDGAEGLHVVRVGRYARREDAERARDQLRDKEKFTPFIVDQK